MTEITLQQFVDDVRRIRRWTSREDGSVNVEMAYTYGFVEARRVIGGYVDLSDVTSTVQECSKMDNLLRNR